MKPNSIIEDSKFRVTKIEKLPDGLIRMHYQFEILVGELDCDPARKYVVARGSSREKGPSLEYYMTHKRDFSPTVPDGEVRVASLRYEVVGTPSDIGHWTSETSYSYPDVRKTGELDEERFRLTAYGLPEPEGIVWEKPRRWLPYWLAGAGALIILVTTLVIRRARRTHSPEKQA